MRIEYTGRQTDVSPAIRGLAERKLHKLGKVLPGITDVHVILTADRHRQIAEVSLHSRKLVLTATEQGAEMAASLAAVVDKLERQAARQIGKRRERKRRLAGLGKSSLSPAAGAGRTPRVVRSRRFVKPMTLDEATLEVGAGEDGFVVFRDAETERVSVLYRRKDGNLGLIEPEA